MISTIDEEAELSRQKRKVGRHGDSTMKIKSRQAMGQHDD
jgi:hypothetical protein